MARITLKEIVSQFLDGNDYGHAEYSKAYRIAVRGWRILNWDVQGQLKEAKLMIRHDLTLELPDDCLSVVEIGVPNSNGTLALLTENKSLNGILDLDVEYDRGIYGDYTDDHMILNKFAGIGSVNNIGEYRVDEDRNLVILSPYFSYREVVIKYNSNHVDGNDSEYTINEMCSEALLAFIIYEWYRHKQGIPQNQKLEHRVNWFNEKRLAKARMNNLTSQSLNDASRLNIKSVIKS